MNGDLATFMVVGAARSGTTWIHHALLDHPQVHAPTKETHFVTPDLARRARIAHRVPTPREYEALYGTSRPAGTRAAGEVSGSTLYAYQEAIPRIREVFGDIRIAMILRDPAARAWSHHLYGVRTLAEPRSFERAIEDEIEGRCDERDWGRHYLGMSRYDTQVAAYQQAFSRVRVYLFDDLVADAASLASDLYRFLGVDPSHRPANLGPINGAGRPRLRALQRWLRPTPARERVRRGLVRIAGERRVGRAVDAVRQRNLVRVEMPDDVRARLRAHLREDVLRLAPRIGRDLSSWLD